MIDYGYTKLLDMDITTAEKKVTEELKKEGFGILTRIDAREKFKEKLGIDFKNYIILGACNPPYAHKSILAEENIGLMLPCNVILYDTDNNVTVSIIRPQAAMGGINNPELKQIAGIVEQKLKNAFDAL